MSEVEDVKQKEQEILKLTNRFCLEHLNMEFASLCEKLVKKMSRQATVLFVEGRTDVWAASVIHALGSINFLFDKSFDPFVESHQIAEFYNLSDKTVSEISDKILQTLDIQMFNTEFSTQYSLTNNPFDKIKVDESGLLYFDNDIEEEEEEIEYQVEGVEPLTRAAFIIKPKQKIVDYFNYIYNENNKLKEIEKLSGVYLVSEEVDNVDPKMLENLLKEKYYLKLFKAELMKFSQDDTLWPEKLSFQMFNDMFEWKFSPIAFDVV